MNIRKEGFPFIAASGLVALLLARTRLFLLGLVPVAFVTWFFRDPDRDIPPGDGLILSPADGTILDIAECTEDRIGQCTKISIFMSVFNVHVNRAMVSGTMIEKRYRPGKFHMANMGKKTEDNERMIHYIKNDKGVFRVDQVAGLIARRISCWPDTGDTLLAGQKMGLIRFGSLLECYLPKGVDVVARIGDRPVAGETILGRIA
ncbi:MAG TPA: phosphatidylserine decarboxylase [Deltaproteobacteria bacterium]|nr:phosphatidylserine decarboxylase [Deltaproteobacteria bacterium]